MTTTYVPFDQHSPDRKFLHDMIVSRCLDGECYAFALALSQGLGWEIAGLMQAGEIRHAVVRRPDGNFFDARGPVTHERLGVPFGLTPPYDLVTLEWQRLFCLRFGTVPEPLASQEIRHLQDAAELVWPELPWREPRSEKFRAFIEEVEELSRKHGVWIFGAAPGLRSTLTVGEGDEQGYVLTPTINNRIWNYRVERVLP